MLAALGQGGTSFDALYVNVERAKRVLRPLAGGLRQGGGTLLPLWYADPQSHFHESFVLLLPGLPARAAHEEDQVGPPTPRPDPVPRPRQHLMKT